MTSCTAELLEYKFLNDTEKEFRIEQYEEWDLEDGTFLSSQVSITSYYAFMGYAETALSSLTCTM
eukprot:CAMPEP_0172503840 /NCGR_PEP_ID=MMETSP1066-20121228/172780_1 /TAXON_ID=671091 /ORGANISM="Coscinodiscus wailesii, Strain CCMP2513" /LENGTH=64 /DNA_ID=CAMNT_0013279741 /DNA_START=9 /DNA_END=200 /DNA_ORIENTATION=+